MRGCRLPPEVCSTRTSRKDWNSAGDGEGGSLRRGEDEATAQTVAAVVRAEAEGLRAGHGVPLHLGREVTNELTVCPPAPHQDFLGLATGGSC